MKQIIEIKSLSATPLLPLTKGRKNKIVLVGGCFDVLHVGHVIFLEKARAKGDLLIVLLESDENIRKNKGENRPINNQENRAKILSKLQMVDKIIKLPEIKNDEEYLKIIKKIKPDIIAVSDGDENLEKKIKQAKEVKAKLLKVTKIIPHQSTSRIIEIIKI